MELIKRQDDTVADVTSTTIDDNGITINAEANMPNYGRVRFTINVESNGERLSGTSYGSGRGAMDDGTFFSGSFSGKWRREGTKAIMHHVVEVSNGDMNLDILEFDATADSITIQHFALN